MSPQPESSAKGQLRTGQLRTGPFRTGPLSLPPFRRLTGAWVSMNLADSALFLMLAVWVKDLTGNDAAAGSVFIFLGLPALVAPLAGRLADAMSRRTLLITGNGTVALVVLLLLFVRGPEDLWLIYAITLIYGTAQYLIGAAQSGLLRDILPDEHIAPANGLFTTIDQGLRILTPLLGTMLYVAFGATAVIALTTVCFGIAALVLLTVKVTETAPAGKTDTYAGIWSGFRLLLTDTSLRLIMIVLAAAFGITGLLNIMVFPLIEQGLGLDPEMLGPISTVQGIGAVVGGLTAAALIKRFDEQRTVAFGVTALALCLVGATAVVIMLPTGSPLALVLVAAAWMLGGFGISWSVVGAVTLRMRVTPPHVQGRTSAAMNMMLNVPQTAVSIVGAGLILFVDFRVLLVVCAAVLVAGALSLSPWRRHQVKAAAETVQA